MNLEDLKTYLDYAKKASTILSRQIDPIGTEMDVLQDVVYEVMTIRMAERDINIPGIERAWKQGIIQGATAYFREKVKKDIMPVQFARDDNLVIEPLYRPQIFGMTNFTVSWTNVTPPAAIDLINYSLQTDKEMIILTDIIGISGADQVPEIQITVDGETQRPLVTRKDFTFGNSLKIYELPFPVVADINLRIQARVESASGTFTYLPVGIHLCLGSIHKKTLT